MRILTLFGLLCVGLATIGVFVPLLPTTPFLLLAIWFFMRSKPEYKQRILDNKLLGPYVRGYMSGFTTSQKVRTLTLMWLVLAISAIFFTSLWWVRLLLAVVGGGVTIHILLMKRGE